MREERTTGSPTEKYALEKIADISENLPQ